MGKILVVDDDRNIRELLHVLLQEQGFEVVEARNGKEALIKVAESATDLAIIDLMMPEMDGFELSTHLRHYYEHMPILMLTAKTELSSKVRGFETGADDYLTKPFEGDELIARVKALLRRYKLTISQMIQIGKTTIDRESYTVVLDKRSVNIPRKEFELLFKLAGIPGRTFSRDQLIDDIWGYDFDGNERTLDVHVGRLRERFPTDQSGFRITTVRGLGYRLEVEQ